MEFIRQWFPNATIKVLHLTRYPAAAVNGLIDGWHHHGFFSHRLEQPVDITDYSDRYPQWGPHWWKFDLPPGWQHFTKQSLTEVCAFQWKSAHHHILQDLNKHPDTDYMRVAFEDLLQTDNQDVCARIADWLGVSKIGNCHTMPPIMATSPPAHNRWRERAAMIQPVLERTGCYALAEELDITMTTGVNTTTSVLPATLGGAGFIPRTQSHAEDINNGLWAACGYRSESAPLRHVMLAQPPATLGDITDPNAWLMHDTIDLAKIREQHIALTEAFHHLNITVDTVCDDASPPNIIFMRDLFWATSEGLVLGRPASQQRAGEERIVAAACAKNGLPIWRMLNHHSVFEGPDILWCDPSTVMVAMGLRTCDGAVRQLLRICADLDADLIPVHLGTGSQHLLGQITFIDHDLVAVAPTASDAIRHQLLVRNFTMIDMPNNDEFHIHRGMNVVVHQPRQIIMPAGCPTIKSCFERHNVGITEVDVSEYAKAGGGIGCAVGIIHRDTITNPNSIAGRSA